MPPRPMEPKSVVADELADAAAAPGTDHGPLCTSGTVMTEHTVAWRWARSVRASAAPAATDVATTLCDEPVSTTKLRRGPPAKRTATLRETSPGTGVTVSGTVVPLPLRSDAGGRRAGRARCTASAPLERRRPRARAARARRPRSRCGRRRSGTGRRNRASPTGSPFPPIWGSVAAVSCWGARPTPSSDHDADGDRAGRAGAPDAGEHGRPGRPTARWRRWARRASMVDCPAPESRTKGNGPWPSMQTLTVSATWPGHRAHGQRHPRRPAGAARWPPLQPAAGGRQREGHLGSTCTEGGVPGALDGGGQHERQHRHGDGDHGGDQRAPAAGATA